MKAPLKTLAIATLIGAGTLVATIETASAFVLRERHVMPGHRHHHHRHMHTNFYPGMYWGGYPIYARPIYVGSYAGCRWLRVMTPWGPRWRSACYY